MPTMKQRSLMLFYSAIKSEKTKVQYERYLARFCKHFGIENPDDLLHTDQKKLQEMIEDFVMYNKSRNNSASLIGGQISAIKLFLSMNDVILNWDKIRKMFPEKKKPTGSVAYTTEQIRILLNNTIYPEYKALIHFLASSGVRVGCVEELRIADLQDMGNGCKSVRVYADTIHEYVTFIHPEAVEAIEKYHESRKKQGEELNENSWVFCSPFDNKKPMLAMTITSTLGRYVKHSLGREKAKSGRYNIMSCHGFRKRFDTILKLNNDMNLSLAERLMGHSVTVQLDNSYFRPTLDKLFDEYKKAIPALLIDEKYELETRILEQQNEITQLKQKDDRITTLENMVVELTKRIETTR